jgi:hypothetical protein
MAVYFEFGYAQTNESFTFQFQGFSAITYTCVFINPGPYQYAVNLNNYQTAGPQVAAAVQARMMQDIGDLYNIERQNNKIRITKKDNAAIVSASVYKPLSNPYFNVIANPEEVWQFNDLAIASITVNLNQVTVIASGSSRPIQFKLGNGAWVNGDTDLQKLFTNVQAGQHTIYIKDNFSELTGIANVLNMQASFVKNNPSTFAGNNGSIDVTVTGGNAPYTYIWDDGPITEDRNNLQAGNYRVVITDASNDTRILQITLDNPGQPVYSVELIDVKVRPRLPEENYTAAANIVELQLRVSINDAYPLYSIDGNIRNQSSVWSGFGSKDYLEGFNQDNYLENGNNQVVRFNFGDYANKYDPANPDRPLEFQFLINNHLADGVINYTSPVLIWYFVEMNSGYKAWTTLEQYRTDTGELTGVTKPNDPSDPDYVAPILDTDSCPL